MTGAATAVLGAGAAAAGAAGAAAPGRLSGQGTGRGPGERRSHGSAGGPATSVPAAPPRIGSAVPATDANVGSDTSWLALFPIRLSTDAKLIASAGLTESRTFA